VAQKIEDAAMAEKLLRELLEKGDDVEAATRAWGHSTLADLRQAAGDVKDAVVNKRAAADLAEADEARRLRFDVARLAADQLGDLALAARTYEELHENEPADREAWEPLALVYRKMGAADKLVELLGKIVEFVEEPGERSRLRVERVKVMMVDLGMKDEEAIPALREIVDEDPSQLEAAIQLAGILERLGREDELVEILGRQLDGAKDRSDASSVASLSRRLGGLLENRDPMEAKNVYYAGLDWEPQNRELLEALVRLHSQGGEPSDRADVMERLLALEHGPNAEKLALELAQIRADAWDEEGTLRALELGFKGHPVSAEMRDRLEAAYRDKSAWPKLAELAVIDARGREDVDDKIARFCEAASIYANELHDPAAAAKVLREAREAAPDDQVLLGELVATLTAAGDFGAAGDELSKAIDALGDANHPALPSLLAQRANMRAKIGDDAGALDDMELAYTAGGASYVRDLGSYLESTAAKAAAAGDIPRWRTLRLRLAEVLPIAGDADGSRTILADLLRHEPKDRDALRALAFLEETQEHWDGASAAYRRLVGLEEGEDVVDTALRLADACERAGRLGDARGGLERARAAAPGNAALRRRIEILYEQTGAFRELAEMSLEDAKAALDVGGRFNHLMRAGSLLLQGGDAAVAIAPLEEAHALRPADLDCIARLADAYLYGGRAAQAAEIVQGTIAQNKGRRSREQSPLYHRLAKIARASGDPHQELAQLAAALDMDGQNGVVASELATVAMAQNQLEVATRALRAVTMLKTQAPMSKALAYQYLGEIARQQGDRKRALMLLKRAVDDDPSLASARALLDALERAD
jgi:tetratricopeptide (TPR) repeat protein